MHYKLGKYLRNRYENLLSDTYDENDIYIRASDVDRTMMSAMSNLAGLYPPKGDQIWNPQVQQPGIFKHIGRSHLITCTIIPYCTFIRNCRVFEKKSYISKL